MNVRCAALCFGLSALTIACPAFVFAQGEQVVLGARQAATDVAVVVAAGQVTDSFGPPVAAAPVEEVEPQKPPSIPAATPTASSATPDSPSWLAPPRPTSAVGPSGSSWTPWVLLLGLSAVGGALFLKRNQSRQRLQKQFGKAEIHVLASSRVGPKAHAVAVEFGGQVYLLGVTDTSVRRLETLSQEQVQRSIVERMDRPATWSEQHGSAPPPEADDDDDLQTVRQKPGAFHAYLDQSVKRAEPAESPAEQLAQNLNDRTSLKGRSRTELVDIEGQAAGLAARLNNTAKSPKRAR